MSGLLGARTDVLDRRAESLTTDARKVQDIRALAQRAVAELQASWNGFDLIALTQLWEQQTSPLLAGASASLDTCAARLRAQSAAQKAASSRDGSGGFGGSDTFGGSGGSGTSGTSGTGLVAAMAPMLLGPLQAPPERGLPAESATWWRSLSSEQQQQVITRHPEWVGDRDGVDFTARDQANRALLIVHRDRLEVERMALDAAIAHDSSRDYIDLDDNSALVRVKDKLASIVAVEATLAIPGSQHQLLLLDMTQDRAQAAIANGNVDTADNVAVFVPGLGANVTDSMKGYDKEMSQMRRKAESESQRANPQLPGATTATVTWIGYQAPQGGPDLFLPGKTVAGDQLAKKGAAELVPFLQGIGAARDDDAHLTLLGHSYGSTTAGLALRHETGVDDALFFGSPGLGTDHLDDLKLAPGHAYYIEAPWDGVGDVGRFGVDPSHLNGIEHASARESTVVDPLTGEIRHFAGVTGHSSYLHDNSTSQHNMSLVVGGVPDQRVIDRSEGLGDLYSWHKS